MTNLKILRSRRSSIVSIMMCNISRIFIFLRFHDFFPDSFGEFIVLSYHCANQTVYYMQSTTFKHINRYVKIFPRRRFVDIHMFCPLFRIGGVLRPSCFVEYIITLFAQSFNSQNAQTLRKVLCILHIAQSPNFWYNISERG